MHRYFLWKKKWLTILGKIYVTLSFRVDLNKRHYQTANITQVATNDFSLDLIDNHTNNTLEVDISSIVPSTFSLDLITGWTKKDVNVYLNELISKELGIDLSLKSRLDLVLNAELLRTPFIWIDLFIKKMNLDSPKVNLVETANTEAEYVIYQKLELDVDSYLCQIVEAYPEYILEKRYNFENSITTNVETLEFSLNKTEVVIIKEILLGFSRSCFTYDITLDNIKFKAKTEVYVNATLTDAIIRPIYPEEVYINRIDYITQNLTYSSAYPFVISEIHTLNTVNANVTYYDALSFSINGKIYNNIVLNNEILLDSTCPFSVKPKITKYSYPINVGMTLTTLLLFRDLDGWIVTDLTNLKFRDLKYN